MRLFYEKYYCVREIVVTFTNLLVVVINRDLYG